VSKRAPLSGDFVDFLCKMRGIERSAALQLLREFVQTRILARTPAPRGMRVQAGDNEPLNARNGETDTEFDRSVK
jgi:hypothetical protein